jgi:hypothetical protein
LQAKAVCLAAERLRDKAVQVRKNALRLLTSLLQHNPFSPSLQLSVLLKKLPQQTRIAYLQQLRDGTSTDADADAPTADAHAEDDEAEEAAEEKPTDTKSPLEYAVEFALGLKKCVPLVAQLLLSPNSSEAVEAIHFFVCAQQFALEEAQVITAHTQLSNDLCAIALTRGRT